MLSFKTFVLQSNQILEALKRDEISHVKSLGLDTSAGKENFKGIIPDGQTHAEIPIASPFDMKIQDHFKNNPVMDRSGKHLGYYTRDPENPNVAIHPDGKKVKLSGVLKNNPELLKQHVEIGSRKESSTTRWTKDIDASKRKIFVSYHPNAVFGKSQNTPWKSCNAWGGLASDHLQNDVEEGGGAAYLTKSSEKNPNNPSQAVGRYALHPYHAIGSDGKFLKDEKGNFLHTIIRPSNTGYGEDDSNERFRNTLRQHFEEHHPMIHDAYKLNPNVYQSDEHGTIIRKPLHPEVMVKHRANLESSIKDGKVTPEQIQHAHDYQYLSHQHKMDIVKHPNTSDASLRTVSEGTSNTNILKGIVIHPNTGDRTLRNIASFKGHSSDVYSGIVKHPSASQETIDRVALSSKSPEVQQEIVNHPNPGWSALSEVAHKTRDPELHKAIVGHPTSSNNSLEIVARSSKHPEVLQKVAEHPKSQDSTLGIVACKTRDPKIHKIIANHPFAEEESLHDVATRSNDSEVHKAIIKHNNVNHQILDTISNKNKNPEIQTLVANRKKELK